MKLIGIAFLVALGLSMATGCSTVADRVGNRLDSAVDRYCEADERTRAAIRDRVSNATAPNTIIVECANDG